MHRRLIAAGVAAVAALLLAAPAWAVSGAGYTTVNTVVDGPNHCKNGNPGVNCNIYDAKEHVWLNGGPAANGLGPDGEYFFAVLAPGGQPNPNDGGAKNLSDDFDAFTNRQFTVSGGEVSAYAGSHTFDNGVAGGAHPNNLPPFIRLFPYADTTNNGGVYIMAICSLAAGYPVEPRDCKYDAFKVKKSVPQVQAVLSGKKYLDGNMNGKLDAGEPGLQNWTITLVGTDGTNTTVKTDQNGDWSYTTTAHAPAAGTTSYTVKEVQQAGWVQTGNTVDQSVSAGGATVALASFTYTVTIPNNAVSAAEGLNFGNFRERPPECPPPTFGVNAQGVPFMTIVVQDAETGLKSIEYTWVENITIQEIGFFVGTKLPVTVIGTAINPALNIGLTFIATDLAGNTTECDPILASVARMNGRPEPTTFTGVPAAESKVTITNDTPGMSGMDIVVNGVVFRVNGLADGETRQLDVASAMQPGNANTVTIVPRGNSGTALVFIANI
jgi:hypothetical protein